MPQVQIVGDGFIGSNKVLTEINMPQVQSIGDYFLEDNEELTKLNMSQLQTIGIDFLKNNKIVPKDIEKIIELSRMKYITPKEALKSALEQTTTTKSSAQKAIQVEKNQSQIYTTKGEENLKEY